MAGGGSVGAVGPFPSGVDTPEQQEEYDKLRRRVLWTLPYGLYVLGSRAGDRRNGMTMNWVSQVSFEPKLLGVGIEKSALTHELVTESGVFVLNTVSREDRSIVRKFTKPVEVDDGREDPQRLPVPRRRHRRADPRPGAGLHRVRGPPAGRRRQPHVLHRRGRRLRLPGRRGHPGPPHGGHPHELRRLNLHDLERRQPPAQRVDHHRPMADGRRPARRTGRPHRRRPRPRPAGRPSPTDGTLDDRPHPLPGASVASPEGVPVVDRVAEGRLVAVPDARSGERRGQRPLGEAPLPADAR